ncbi:MAG: hypothetical protein ACRDD2_00365 [Sarcina sp.]
MKGKKILFIIIGISILGISLISCGKQGNPEATVNENTLSNNEIERLPEEQQDTELDKKIAAMRAFRKKNLKSENGSMTAISQVDTDLPGQSKNRPKVDEGESRKQLEVINIYLAKKFNIDINNENEIGKIDSATCIDPRVNAIYDDEDKGIAKGYENNDIHVQEYEDKDGSYKYLILVKDKDSKAWKVIKDGNGYKE